jgi:vancomycin permeability regulator SanA
LLTVHTKTRGLIYNDINNAPGKRVAIVFGASVNPKRDLPSDILADRIKTAVDLYKAGKVEKILMSGDNRVTHYNEPIVMKSYAEWFNVPSDDIVLDYAGRRTYDTCYRAKEIFQLDEAVLVTQRYHLYRALYTCDSLGLKVIGVSAERQPYRGQFYYNLREIPATVLAVWQVNITKPKPVLGEKETVFDEGA